ncbi:MAG: hypothetical protein WHT81_01345, partial [Rectinemataceae bacterium]
MNTRPWKFQIQTLTLICLLLAFAMSVQAQARPSPQEILRELDNLGNFSGKDFSAVFTIVT